MNINTQLALDRNDFVPAKVHVPMSPGEALRMLRNLQDLSQFELSSMIGISQPNLSALENGRINMGRETALSLASALRVHPSVLLFPDYDMTDVA